MSLSDKQRTFLATTALEEFWDTTQPMLFLGEWCKPFHRQPIDKNIDSETLQHPSINEANSRESYDYTVNVYEEMLPTIMNWLNQIHKTNYSLKYWRMVIGPFLLWYIQIIYLRFSHLKMAFSLYPDIQTIGLAHTSYMTPLNTREFYMWASESDAWNLQLYTQIASLVFKKPQTHRDFHWYVEKKQRQESIEQRVSYRKRTKLKLKLLKMLTQWRASKIVGLCVCVHEFSKLNLIRLVLSSKCSILPMVQAEDADSLSRTNTPDLSLRMQIAQLPAMDDFTKLVLDTLVVNMPFNFIEYYKEESEQSEKSYPYSPGVIVSTGWMQHDRVKFWGAKKAEQGAKIVNIQHGGAYGVAKYFTSELLERKNCDRFISWGWQEDSDVVQAPSILVCERMAERKRKLKDKKTKNHLILWSATDAVRFPPFIGSYLSYLQQSYFDWQSRFANTLSPEVFSEIVMRLRPASNHSDYVQKLLPKLKIHRPEERSSFFDQLSSAKILVSDNFHTTFLYGLAFNIPTILFWDKTCWEIREKVKPFFKALHDAGIYHDTPESAAEKLNSIARDPMQWWREEKVQSARKDFCNQFAFTSRRWLSEWNHLLLSCKKIVSQTQ